MVRQRQTKTEAKIKAAFTTLVKNKGFDAMTVSDLAREADINRGTFYMHYVDKFDLRDQLLDDVIADLAAILIPESDDDNEPLDVEDIIKSRNLVSAMRYLKRDHAFFDAISGSGNDMQLYERVKDVIKQLLLGQVSRLRKAPDDTPGIPGNTPWRSSSHPLRPYCGCGYAAAARNRRKPSQASSNAANPSPPWTYCVETVG